MGIKKSRTGRPPVYAESFKSAICLEVLSGKLSYIEARRFYGIKGNHTIARWVKQYEEQCLKVNLASMNTSEERNPDQSMSHPDLQTELQEKTRELEAALKLAQLKITALETMIDIAESELHIDIRKKSGTKQ